MAKKTNYKSASGNEYFRVRKDFTNKLGVKPDGKRNIMTFYGSSKKAAEAKRDDFIEKLNSGLNIEKSSQPLEPLIKIGSLM